MKSAEMVADDPSRGKPFSTDRCIICLERMKTLHPGYIPTLKDQQPRVLARNGKRMRISTQSTSKGQHDAFDEREA